VVLYDLLQWSMRRAVAESGKTLHLVKRARYGSAARWGEPGNGWRGGAAIRAYFAQRAPFCNIVSITGLFYRAGVVFLYGLPIA
jgi:hypothetical protein